MIEIERIDLDWWRSDHLDYRDDGYTIVGGKTRQFSVFARKSRSLLGYIKWWTKVRAYCFFPLNSVFGADFLAEIAQFCEEATAVHKSRIVISIPEKQRRIKERRQNRIKKLAEERLTKKKSDANIDSVSKVPEPNNLVVEAAEAAL